MRDKTGSRRKACAYVGSKKGVRLATLNCTQLFTGTSVRAAFSTVKSLP
jgi:hypothetical protein